MTMPRQKPTAVAVVGYIGVLYAAIAVFAVTLFYSTALDYGRSYEYPPEHWILASGVAVTVAGLLLFAVNALLRDTRTARERS